ncbi:MAG TPA: glucose-6-phosphate isomerase [Alphaproteobacteria bacterium]|nr:glucose-6-phosphate isomerase [Alphaproteobacteria bacterium]
MTDARAPETHPETSQRLDFARGPGPYLQSVDACLAERIGRGGASRAAYEATLAATAPALERLRATLARGGEKQLASILSLPRRRDDLAAIEAHARALAGRFEEIVVLGTGGSSLGGRALAALAGDLPAPGPGRPRLRFLDNVDGETFAALLEGEALARTGFLAISKSGATAETLGQLLVSYAAVRRRVGEAAAAAHFLAVAEPGDNPLRAFAGRAGISVLDHDPDLGGRFSALSLVGLLPAAIAGVDPAAVRAGAASVLASLEAAKTPAGFAPAAGAAVSVVLARECGVAITVLMPYADRLAPFGLWFRQLWAESLGKDGKGTTPVRALGTVDQHSQLQLYLDGPRDKMFTLLVAAREGTGPRVEQALARDPRLAYLAGQALGDLFAAEQRATYDTLAASGRPVRVLSLARADAEALGALMMHFMLETIVAAELMGVDPFGQPAVEDGKRRARDYLAGAGGRIVP